MKEKTCAFTGHRQLHTAEEEIRRRLQVALMKAMAIDGYTRFLSGGAPGFDLIAAEEVLALRDKGLKAELVMVLPCPAEVHSKRRSEEEKARYFAILDRAAEVVVTSPALFRGAMHVRNRYLIDHSSYCLAWQEREEGGTAYTTAYAAKQGVPVQNLAKE